MKRISLTLMIMILMGTLLFISGCREKTPEEKINDGIEEIGDGIEDAADEVEDAIE